MLFLGEEVQPRDAVAQLPHRPVLPQLFGRGLPPVQHPHRQPGEVHLRAADGHERPGQPGGHRRAGAPPVLCDLHTPALIVFAALLGPGWWAGLLLTVQLAAFRCIGELFHVWVWDRWEKQPGKSFWYIAAVTVTALGGAYATLLLPTPPAHGAVPLQPGGVHRVGGLRGLGGHLAPPLSPLSGPGVENLPGGERVHRRRQAERRPGCLPGCADEGIRPAGGGRRGPHRRPEGVRLPQRPVLPAPPAAAEPAGEVRPGHCGRGSAGGAGRRALRPGHHDRAHGRVPHPVPAHLRVHHVSHLQHPGPAHLQGHVLQLRHLPSPVRLVPGAEGAPAQLHHPGWARWPGATCWWPPPSA